MNLTSAAVNIGRTSDSALSALSTRPSPPGPPGCTIGEDCSGDVDRQDARAGAASTATASTTRFIRRSYGSRLRRTKQEPVLRGHVAGDRLRPDPVSAGFEPDRTHRIDGESRIHP